jgi:hypothetical protein
VQRRPKKSGRPSSKRWRGERKQLQLCGQVRDALVHVLADDPDELIQNLDVVETKPGLDGATLVVGVRPFFPITAEEAGRIAALLACRSRKYRAEVAASITRKHAPNLQFYIAPTN